MQLQRTAGFLHDVESGRRFLIIEQERIDDDLVTEYVEIGRETAGHGFLIEALTTCA